MQTRVQAEEFLQKLAFMGGRIVQQHDPLAAQMSKKVAQEKAYFLLPNIVVEQIVVEAQSLPLRADRNRGDHRHLIPPTGMTMNWSLADRCPGLSHIGDE